MSSANLPKYDPVDISEDDVMTALKAMQGYIDITPADFREWTGTMNLMT
jgi:CBS domain-containing membrane protein